MLNLTPNEQSAVTTFCRSLQNKWGARVRDVRVFGSRARSEGNEDSDIDILVIVDDFAGGIRRDIYATAADFLLSHEVVISPLVMAQAQYDSMKSRERMLIREIERDGVTL